jgi:hypothetical protein
VTAKSGEKIACLFRRDEQGSLSANAKGRKMSAENKQITMAPQEEAQALAAIVLGDTIVKPIYASFLAKGETNVDEAESAHRLVKMREELARLLEWKLTDPVAYGEWLNRNGRLHFPH